MEPVIGRVVTDAEEAAPAAPVIIAADCVPPVASSSEPRSIAVANVYSGASMSSVAPAMPISTSPLLPQRVARSDDWRTEGDAEERKIRFIASLPFWQRMRINWRRTPVGRVCEMIPCVSAWMLGPLFLVAALVTAVAYVFRQDLSRLACPDGAQGQLRVVRAWAEEDHSWCLAYNVSDAATGVPLVQLSFVMASRLIVSATPAGVALGFPTRLVWERELHGPSHHERTWAWSTTLGGQPMVVRAVHEPAGAPRRYFAPETARASQPGWMQRLQAKVNPTSPRASESRWGVPDTAPGGGGGAGGAGGGGGGSQSLAIDSVHYGYTGRVFMRPSDVASRASRLELPDGPAPLPGWQVMADDGG